MKTLSEIKVEAFNYQHLPDDDLPMPEALLWYTLRDIYHRFRSGAISDAQGKAESKKAMMRYNADRTKLDVLQGLAEHNAKMWQLTEQARSNYRLNRTLENADALAEAWDGAKAKRNEVMM